VSSIPKPIEIIKPIRLIDTIIKEDTIWQEVDTQAILTDYYTQRIYADTLENDTSYFIATIDTVFNNRLVGKQIYFKNLRPTKIINTEIITNLNKFRVFIGGDIGTTFNNFSVEPGLMFIPRTDLFAIKANYKALFMNGQRFDGFETGFYYKFKLKK